MGDVMIGAAPAGQPGATSGGTTIGVQVPQAAPESMATPEQNQPHDNYDTSEQLNGFTVWKFRAYKTKF